MFDESAELSAELAEVVEKVKGLGESLPSNFTYLRNATHELALPSGFRLYGPVLVPQGAQIEIMDSFMRPLQLVLLTVPESWHDSDW